MRVWPAEVAHPAPKSRMFATSRQRGEESVELATSGSRVAKRENSESVPVEAVEGRKSQAAGSKQPRSVGKNCRKQGTG